MFDIKDFISRIGDFGIITEKNSMKFEGTLFERNEKMLVSGRIDIAELRLLDKIKQYRILGSINGVDITLMDAYVRFVNLDAIYATIEVEASEIIVGRQIRDDGCVRVASMELPEIKWFFSENQFDFVDDYNKESPSLLKFCFPDDIVVHDDYGTLTITRRLHHTLGKNIAKCISIPVLLYEFEKPLPVITARAQIAKARNLFLFFADGYLPLHDIELADTETTTEYYSSYCDFKMIHNCIEESIAVNEPFFVTSNTIKDVMQAVWENWCELYTHKFLSALYYEVIRNRATWINNFLNIVQAIDLYENTYRKTEARVLAPKKLKNGRYLPLSCFIKDALTQLDSVLGMDNDIIYGVAQNINIARDYFTHYNGNYREPSFPEVIAMSRLLQLLYLGLIYRKLGVPDIAITTAKKRRKYSVFERDISIILREPINNVDYTYFF